MNIKRFVAADMRQAIRRVREEHGPDAVILKCQRGPNGVEVLSAIDFDDRLAHAQPEKKEANQHHVQQLSSEMQGGTTTWNTRGKSTGNVSRISGQADVRSGMVQADARSSSKTISSSSMGSTRGSGQIDAVERELRSIRGLLQTELASLMRDTYARREPVRAEILRHLCSLGLDNSLARRLSDRVHDTSDLQRAWREALGLLTRMIPRLERDILLRGGRIALFGPTGVGKTTTATKLAAVFSRRHGRQTVAMIGTDGGRPDAQRELLALGQQLGVYTLVATTPSEVREALEAVSDRRLVLIDTPGMSQRDPRLVQQRAIVRDLPFVEPWLVLAANIQRASINDTIRQFACLSPRGCVLTKIDECAALGGPLGTIVTRGLPLAFISNGQRVPDDLVPARADLLVSRMVSLQKERRRKSRLAAGKNNQQNIKGSELTHG